MNSLNFRPVILLNLLVSIALNCSACVNNSDNNLQENNVIPNQTIQNVSANSLTASPTPVNQDETIERIEKITGKLNPTKKDYEELKRLISLKPNLNVRNQGDTSMLVGTMFGDLTVFKMLLDAGADPNFPSHHVGCEMEESCLKPPIYIAFLDHNTEAVRLLVEHGVNPNEGDDPYLAWAVSRDYTDMVKMLIEHKADVNYLNNWKQSPIFFIKSTDAGKMLLKAGADINQQDEDGQTALTSAIVYDEPEMGYDNLKVINFFIKNGADVNVKDKNGKSALQIALENKQINKVIIKELQKAGAK